MLEITPWLSEAVVSVLLFCEPAILTKQLGSESYSVRQQAATRLVAAGPRVLPYLRLAMSTHDLEAKRRMENCIEVIQRDPEFLELAEAYHRHMVAIEMMNHVRGRCLFPDLRERVAVQAALISPLEQKLRARGVSDGQLHAMKAEILESHRQFREKQRSAQVVAP
jgi:hypothetical protein